MLYRLPFHILFIALIFTCFSTNSHSETITIPNNIKQFYEDLNFVNLHSTKKRTKTHALCIRLRTNSI